MKKRIVAWLAAVMLLAAVLPFGWTAAAEAAVEIHTVAELMAIDDSEDNIKVDYVLKADLDLKGVEWEPLFGGSYTYMGTFDGNGHVIRNFKVTGTHKYAGLFAKAQHKGRKLGDASTTANIINLGVENVTINVVNNGDVHAGAIVGWFGAADRSTELLPYTHGMLKNCYASGSVTATSTSLGAVCEAGGLAGYIFTGAVQSSAFTGTVTANGKPGKSGSSFVTARAGGLVGYMNNSEISGSYAAGKVTAATVEENGASGKTELYAGGLLAESDSTTNVIRNSFALTEVSVAGEKAKITNAAAAALADMKQGDVNTAYYMAGAEPTLPAGVTNTAKAVGTAASVKELFTASWQKKALGSNGGLTFADGAAPVQSYQKSGLGASAIGSIAAQTGTGKALRPAITVKQGGKKLTKGSQYLPLYVNSILPCENGASVLAVGIGNYSGAAYRNFSIQLKAPKVTVSHVKEGVSVTWDAVPSATRYKVERKVGKGAWEVLKPTVYVANCVDTAVKEGTSYAYRVKAYYDQTDPENPQNSKIFESAWSNTPTITAKAVDANQTTTTTTTTTQGEGQTTTTTVGGTTTQTQDVGGTTADSTDTTTVADGTTVSTTAGTEASTDATTGTTTVADGTPNVSEPGASTDPAASPSYWWIWLILLVPLALIPVIVILLLQDKKKA